MGLHNCLKIIPLFFANILISQNDNLGSWNIYNLKYNTTTKYSYFFETQVRSLKFYDDFHYFEIKGGVNYKFNEQLTVSLGAGNYQTFKEGGNFITPKNNNELRFWPQILLNQKISFFKIEQRYRIENRFTSDGYKNRFRYRLGIALPFGKEKNEVIPYQIGINNELFFTDNEPFFERNRLGMVFNFRKSKCNSFQIGYVHQFDYKINDETGRDFLQLGYFYEIF